MSQSDTPTPRTDYERGTVRITIGQDVQFIPDGTGDFVPVESFEALERELAQAQESNRVLREALEELRRCGDDVFEDAAPGDGAEFFLALEQADKALSSTPPPPKIDIDSTAATPKALSQVVDKIHIIVGANGMCMCGADSKTCRDILCHLSSDVSKAILCNSFGGVRLEGQEEALEELGQLVRETLPMGEAFPSTPPPARDELAEGLALAVEAIHKPLGDETEDSGNPCAGPSPGQGRAISRALRAYRAKHPKL